MHTNTQSLDMGMNWDSEREMQRDVEENPELYEALADSDDE